jgi:glutamate synthase domain-containing protein 1
MACNFVIHALLVDIWNFLFYQAADMNDILAERGACGVGFVANLNNEPSFNIVRDALTALGCMEHRGGCGADNDSGDGAGLMSGIPWDLFNEWGSKQGLAPFEKTHTGVGMVFLPQDDNSAAEAKAGNVSDAAPQYICSPYRGAFPLVFKVQWFLCFHG